MAIGLKASGYNLVFANDFNKQAVQAYAHNIGDYVVCGNIASSEIQSQIPDADIIAGGPPCQDYSIAGSGEGEEGERGKLVWEYLDIIERKKPKAFVFENVKGLITKRHRPTFDALLEKFGEIGYTVSWQVVNAWDYGVAQKRERVFIVGIRNDLGFTFEFPSADWREYRTQTLYDAIGDLPEPEEQTNGGHLSNNFNTLYEMANRSSDMRMPSTTVTAHHRCSYIHPKNRRRFTVRECLRIQSVPDWYVLPSDISLSAQYRIVGNGVASRVAYVIGIALADQLNIALHVQEAA